MKNSTQNKQKIFFFLISCFIFINAKAQTVSTLAGSSVGFADGTGNTAHFNFPAGVAVAADGTVYVADASNHQIRKITAAGIVTTLAGSTTAGFADGLGTTAKFAYPSSVAVANDGSVFVADRYNNRIRKITQDGLVSTLAGSTLGYVDGPGATAKFNEPNGVAVDNIGNVYVGDDSNNCIRKITAAGVVSTLAGSTTAGFADGIGALAKFNRPMGVAVAADGTVYVADYFNRRVRKITPSGEVTSLAGSTAGYADGTGTAAKFWNFTGVTVAADGTIFVADTGNALIRKITPIGEVTTFAGHFGTEGFLDGIGTSAWFNVPSGVAVATDGTIFVADTNNHRIRKIMGFLATSNVQIKNPITVFPNPASSIIYFQTTNGLQIDKITITDLTGKVVLEKNNTNNQVNIQELSNGMYILKSTSNQETFFTKFLKE